MQLKDKVAIITGSARGMGKTFALRFAREGAKLTICDILDCETTAKEIETIGGEVLALKTDVTSEEDTVEMAKKTVERFGRIDILINNAAIYGGIEMKDFIKPIEEIRGDEWDKILAVNVKGVFLCCKAVIPYMKKQGGGKIVNIASTAGLTGKSIFLHYSTSKGAVITLTKGLAEALGDFNINVNAVAPAMVWTEATQSLLSEELAQQEVDTMQILHRKMMPEDIAGSVVFLSSDDSSMMTGQTVAVNAGYYLH